MRVRVCACVCVYVRVYACTCARVFMCACACVLVTHPFHSQALNDYNQVVQLDPTAETFYQRYVFALCARDDMGGYKVL